MPCAVKFGSSPHVRFIQPRTDMPPVTARPHDAAVAANLNFRRRLLTIAGRFDSSLNYYDPLPFRKTSPARIEVTLVIRLASNFGIVGLVSFTRMLACSVRGKNHASATFDFHCSVGCR